MTRTDRRRFFTLVLVTGVMFVACSRKEDAPPSAVTPAGTADHGDAGIDTMEGADPSPKSAVFAGTGITYLTDVRTARHEGYDRVVFEFAGELPGYTVEYVDPPILSDGAGERMQVAGNFFLQVRMSPASGVDLRGPELRWMYTGRDRVKGSGSEVKEVVRTGDFEAHLTWVIGVEDRVDFRVSTLSSPSRLTIDLRNH